MQRPKGFLVEDEGAKRKWDAWRCEQGLLTMEAKRRYIAFLIETMRLYVGGSVDGLELLNELEFMWDQIKNIPIDDVPDHTTAQFSPWSPLSSQFYALDRFSSRTPSIAASNKVYDRSQHVYSHSRIPSHIKHEGRQHPGFQSGVGLSSSQIQPQSHILDSMIYPPSFTSKPPVNSGVRARKDEFDYIWAKVVNKNISSNTKPDTYNAAVTRKLDYLMKFLGRNILSVARTLLISTIITLIILWWLKKNAKLRSSIASAVTLTAGSSMVNSKTFALELTIDATRDRMLFRVVQLLNGFVSVA